MRRREVPPEARRPILDDDTEAAALWRRIALFNRLDRPELVALSPRACDRLAASRLRRLVDRYDGGTLGGAFTDDALDVLREHGLLDPKDAR